MRSLQARQKSVESSSSANDMDPGSVPNQLKGLTQAEEMLIAKCCPAMRDECTYLCSFGEAPYGNTNTTLHQHLC